MTSSEKMITLYRIRGHRNLTDGRGGMSDFNEYGYFATEDAAYAVMDKWQGIMGTKPANGTWKGDHSPHFMAAPVELTSNELCGALDSINELFQEHVMMLTLLHNQHVEIMEAWNKAIR